MRSIRAGIVAALLLPMPAFGQRAGDSPDRTTIIYFIRHAEVDPTPPTFPLSAEGRRKADAAADALAAVRLTHVFASHTTRARQMVEPAAQRRQLEVRQLPVPGARLQDGTVSDTTSSSLAIAPLVRALRELPAGSRALVGVNSDNVYAIMHGLGVPVATGAMPCAHGASCVPCLTRECASSSFDQIWVLVANPAGEAPLLIELRYGPVAR